MSDFSDHEDDSPAPAPPPVSGPRAELRRLLEHERGPACVAAVATLLQAQPGLATEPGEKGRLPLHEALVHRKDHDSVPELVALLLAADPQTVRAVDGAGCTALYIAAALQEAPVVATLRRYHCQPVRLAAAAPDRGVAGGQEWRGRGAAAD